MKSVATILVALVSVSAFGQTMDDINKLKEIGGQLISAGQAHKERSTLSKEEKRYNGDQPDVSLLNARVLVKSPQGEGFDWLDSRHQGFMKSNIEGSITAVRGHPVWNDQEMQNESQERRQHRGDDEVDQATLPAKGRIAYRKFVASYEFVDFQKSQDTAIAIGRWWNQTGIRVSRETAYFGLTVTLRDGDTGEALAVYKTLGVASSADNVGVNVANSFFGNDVGFESHGNSDEERRFRAMANALRQMHEVIKTKCQ